MRVLNLIKSLFSFIYLNNDYGKIYIISKSIPRSFKSGDKLSLHEYYDKYVEKKVHKIIFQFKVSNINYTYLVEYTYNLDEITNVNLPILYYDYNATPGVIKFIPKYLFSADDGWNVYYTIPNTSTIFSNVYLEIYN